MKMAMIAMLAFVATDAMAGSYYYAMHTLVTSHPTGKGLVYSSFDYTPEEDVADELFKPESELQEAPSSLGIYIYNKPAEGYRFAGYSKATFNEMGEPVFNDSVVTTSSYLELDNESTFDDQATAEAAIPLDPNNVIYALFARVTAEVAPELTRMGSVKIDKVVNEVGDKVTMTATTAYDPTAKFAYWVKESTGEKLTANPLTVDVTGTDNYVAYFESELIVKLDFTGKKCIEWYNPRTLYLGDSIKNYGFNADYYLADSVNVEAGRRLSYFDVFDGGYQIMDHNAALLFGKGEQIAVLDTAAAYYDETQSGHVLRYALGEMKVDTMAADCKYYTVDYNNRLLTLKDNDAIIPQGEIYAAVPVSMLMPEAEAPKYIFWSLEEALADDPTGITNTMMEVRKSDDGIYTIGGVPATSLVKGQLYIKNNQVIRY